MRAFLLNLVLVCVSVIVGFVLIEGGYRVYLWTFSSLPKAAAASDGPPTYTFYDRSHWEYDQEFGYTYPAGRKLLHGSVTSGRLTSCDVIDTINERGNIGPIRGDYDSAALKILLFGDSFPAFITNGETFPSRLQTLLQEMAGIDAHVVNFGRDGTGILQMVDLAAAKVPEWKPDLVIITFISDDLDRVRIWRTATEIDGEPRLLVTDRPDPDPGLDAATDAFFLFPDATPEWCERTLRNGGIAPELDELNARYIRMKTRAGRATPGLLSLDHSFVLSRILAGNPYLRLKPPPGVWYLPRVQLGDYREDPRFVAALDRLKQTGVPVIFIHLPIAPELMEGQPMLLGRQQELWRSLDEAMGKPAYRLADYIQPPVENPLAMSHTPTDHHPSPFGMQVYANAIARILAQEGIIPELPAELDRPDPAPAAAAGPGVTLVRSDLRCPFRHQVAGEAAPPWGLPLWQIFRYYRPPPPMLVATEPAPEPAPGQEPQPCLLEIREAPQAAVPDLDWRIGHNLHFGHDWWNRELTFRIRLRADRPVEFGDAALVLDDGSRQALTPIPMLDGEWREFAVAMQVQPQVSHLRLWLQLAHESPISGPARIEINAAETELGPPGAAPAAAQAQ